jgi:prevent-host-death family protein
MGRVLYLYIHTVFIERAAAMLRTVKASEFKAKCLAMLDEVERTRETVVITKRGKPVTELIPHTAPKRNARGILKGRTEIIGDIISPIDVEWEVLK